MHSKSDRTYRHQLRVERPFNRDARVLIMTRYSWLGSGDIDDTHDGRSEVLTNSGWREFDPWGLLDDFDLPQISGMEQSRLDAVDRKLGEWEDRIRTIFDAELDGG